MVEVGLCKVENRILLVDRCQLSVVKDKKGILGDIMIWIGQGLKTVTSPA